MTCQMSAITFECYEDELREVLEQMTAAVSVPTFDTALVRTLQSQAEELLQQMTLEAQSCGQQDLKEELMVRVRAAKSNVQARQVLLREREKEGLFAGAAVPSTVPQEQMLAAQNEQLARARQSMRETEETAAETINELAENRARLTSAHGRVHEMSAMTDRAQQLLQSMQKRRWWS